jgi:hypothetical protein
MNRNRRPAESRIAACRTVVARTGPWCCTACRTRTNGVGFGCAQISSQKEHLIAGTATATAAAATCNGRCGFAAATTRATSPNQDNANAGSACGFRPVARTGGEHLKIGGH